MQCVYLIAASYMYKNKEISSYNEPARFLEGEKNVVIDTVSKSPVTNSSNRKITKSDHDISNKHALPHGFF